MHCSSRRYSVTQVVQLARFNSTTGLTHRVHAEYCHWEGSSGSWCWHSAYIVLNLCSGAISLLRLPCGAMRTGVPIWQRRCCCKTTKQSINVLCHPSRENCCSVLHSRTLTVSSCELGCSHMLSVLARRNHRKTYKAFVHSPMDVRLGSGHGCSRPCQCSAPHAR